MEAGSTSPSFRSRLARRLPGAAALARRLRREPPLYPRLRLLADALGRLSTHVYEPARRPVTERLRLLEAKTEYLLDENYRLKSVMRDLMAQSELITRVREYQLRTFDFEWKHLPYHDEFLTNPSWREKAAADVAARVGVDPEWFRGKKVLDCGCGPGRHAWVFGTLGASVDAFDMSDNGLAAAREASADLPDVRFHKHDVLAPLPFGTDYDLVWCYGVLHHTIAPFQGLTNIARHVKPGGRIYLMLYSEPPRDSLGAYQYYHETWTLRQATRAMPFEEKAALVKRIEGERGGLGWFDAVSPDINELYSVEEIQTLLQMLGFTDVARTMPHEDSHNVVARRLAS